MKNARASIVTVITICVVVIVVFLFVVFGDKPKPASQPVQCYSTNSLTCQGTPESKNGNISWEMKAASKIILNSIDVQESNAGCELFYFCKGKCQRNSVMLDTGDIIKIIATCDTKNQIEFRGRFLVGYQIVSDLSSSYSTVTIIAEN
jgi:hypothetical protein